MQSFHSFFLQGSMVLNPCEYIPNIEPSILTMSFTYKPYILAEMLL